MEASPPADNRSELELEAERAGKPFLLLTTDDGTRVVALEAGTNLRFGRGPNVDVDLGADTEVSRVHAEIRHDGGRWAVLDDEQSRNGTFVNEHRVRGWQGLEDGDSLRLGRTELRFRDPTRAPDAEADAAVAEEAAAEPGVSDADRALLRELCRPLAYAREGAEPAGVDELAAALDRDGEDVEAELSALADRFGIKATAGGRDEALAEVALRGGLVRVAELEPA